MKVTIKAAILCHAKTYVIIIGQYAIRKAHTSIRLAIDIP